MSPVAFVYFACVLFIFSWSLIRFFDISRPYRTRINFSLLLAFTYAFYYFLLFVLIVSALSFLSSETIELIDRVFKTNWKDAFKESPEIAPPLLSTAFLYKAHDIRFFYKLDNFIVDRLLSTTYLTEDFNHLKVLLEHNEFFPSKVEFAANLKMMEEFDVFVSNPLEEPPDLHSGDPITLWRKVSTLLRLCESWVAKDRDTERAIHISELQEEHQRRTGVALHLLRLKLSTETYQEIKPPVEHEKQDALILTSNELNRTTKLVSQYIIADYKKLMSTLSQIAAHMVIYSGASASKRLEQLSEAGFKGLGSFREMTFHKIVFLLAIVFGVAFVVLYASFYIGGGDPRLALTTKIATIYAFAALSGALIGSSRRLMSKNEMPWGWYLLAGILGWLVWLSVSMLIDLGFASSASLADRIGAYFTWESWKGKLAWSLLPLSLAAGVAALSHRNPLTELWKSVNDRISDGVMLGVVLIAGLSATVMLHIGWGTSWSRSSLVPGGEVNWLTVVRLPIACFILGFVSGLTVISIARNVARSGLATDS